MDGWCEGWSSYHGSKYNVDSLQHIKSVDETVVGVVGVMVAHCQDESLQIDHRNLKPFHQSKVLKPDKK